MAKWFLDVKVSKGRCLLEVYDDASESVDEMDVKLKFYGYVLAREPERVAHQLVYENLVDDVWVEDWLMPPHYRDRGRVLVYVSGSLENHERLVATFRRRGFHVVNTHPHPIVEALYRVNLKPLTKLIGHGSSWDPREQDPAISYATVSVENGFYIVETMDGVEQIADVADLAHLLRTVKPLLVFSDKATYVAVVNEDESVVEVPHLWITAGPFTPHVVFEWSRLSYTPLSLMSNVTIGRLLSTIEALKARDWKYIAGREWSRVENFRGVDELFLWDRGGSIHQPKPGLYWNVCQLDFKSLYPSIIVKLNVSGETVNDPYCVERVKPHYTPHAMCLDREGLVASTIRGLIDLKDLYDKLFRETGMKLYRERKSAVKWILVASFGYLGYRNSIFGSVSAHEVVTSTARFITARAFEKAVSMGYRVIHTLVDSLFVHGVGNIDECSEVAKRIGEHVGYELKVEAHYIWLYVPRSVTTGFGASNRYYGALSTGGLKIKGLTIVRRDVPLFIKQVGFKAYEQLASARNLAELRGALSKAIAVIEDAKRMILNRGVDVRLLVFSRVESRAYAKPPKYVVYGKAPYRYLATRSGFTPLDALDELDEVNYSYYVKLLDKVKEELPKVEER